MSKLNDIWVVGDKFMGQVFKTLQALRTDTRSPVYMYEYYNICPYYTGPTSRIKNTITNIFNGVAAGLNEHLQLPKYVIFIPDIDIVRSIDFYNFGMPKTFEKCIKYMITHVGRYFQARYESLRKQRPGSVSSDPCFIWLNVINRPAVKDHPERDRLKIWHVDLDLTKL